MLDACTVAACPRGLYPVVPTPLADGRVDTESIDHHVAWLSSRVDGVTALGSSGESAYLDPVERRRAVEAYAAATADHGLGLILGVTTPSTSVALEQVQAPEAAGCAAFMVLPPTYYAATLGGAERHLCAIASATETPLLHYEIPGLSGLDLGPDGIADLAERVPTLAGVKVAVPNLDLVTALGQADLALFAGWDDLLHEQVLAGCDGVMAPVAAVVPEAAQAWWSAVSVNDDRQALAIFVERLLPVCHAMAGADGDFVAALKRMLRHAGVFATAEVLPGMPQLTEARTRQVDAALRYVDEALPVGRADA